MNPSMVVQRFSLLLGLAVGSPAFGSSLIENVTQRPYTQAEQAITIERDKPNTIFIATNRSGGSGDQTSLVSARSTDGGNTWTRGTFANGSDGLLAASYDPSLTSDSFGNLYVTYISHDNSQVIVGRSTDGGDHWTQLPTDNLGAGDEPTIVAGPGKKPGEQSIWLTWTNGNLWAAGATATGLGSLQGSFSPQVVPYTLDPLNPKVEGYGDIAIGPGGEVVVAHQDIASGEGPDAIRVNINRDGIGGAFGPTVTATPPNATSPTDPINKNVVIGAERHPSVQSARSVDSEAGLAWNTDTNRLFMVYTDETSDSFDFNNDTKKIYDTNIELIYSDDDGTSWSSPLRINDDATDRSQFLPKIALDPTTGNLAIVWYDARNDDGTGTDGQRDNIPNDEAELWGTLSLDGGQSFVPNFKISAGMSSAPLAEGDKCASPPPNDPNDYCFDYGDYIGLDFFNNTIRPVWADNSNSTGDNPDMPSFDAYTVGLAVPEPTTLALLSLGLAGIGFGKRRSV